jgi:hypothetical protein
MKRAILLVFLAALVFTGSVFAQQNSSRQQESEFYYFNFPIEKIYAYRMGYIVVYRKGLTQMARTFIPEDWFGTMGDKGDVVMLSSGREWPSMSVYYKNGEFSHVRLKLRREKTHPSWGVIPLNVNMDEYFQNIEEVVIEFQ